MEHLGKDNGREIGDLLSLTSDRNSYIHPAQRSPTQVERLVQSIEAVIADQHVVTSLFGIRTVSLPVYSFDRIGH